MRTRTRYSLIETRQKHAKGNFDWNYIIDPRPEIDAGRIGYYGISLGGVIGTIFCSVEERVKVPVIALAGGALNLMFGKELPVRESYQEGIDWFLG